MKRALSLSIALAAGLSLSPVALAQRAESAPAAEQPAAQPAVLVVGDPAPPLDVEAFVKGEPVKAFEKGKVYIVEFWATWCGPCRKAFPHISKIQTDYKGKGLTVIGVNVWEEQNPKAYTPETLEKVKKFVNDQGEKMAYTVAYDGAAAKMTKAYMEAGGQDGIPASFIVNQEGKVAWIGNPHDPEFDNVVKSVIEKTHTLDPAEVSKAREDAVKRQQGQSLFKEFVQKMQGGEQDAAMKVADKLIDLGGPYGRQAASFKFGYLLEEKGDVKGAVAFGKTALAGIAKDDTMLLNQMAWSIVDPQGNVQDKDLDFAMAAATRAVELTKEKDGAVLDTLARVYWLKGDKAKAVGLQKKAVALAPEQMKADLEKTLKEYEGGK